MARREMRHQNARATRPLIEAELSGRWKPLGALLRTCEPVLHIGRLNELYGLCDGSATVEEFLDRAIQVLGVRVHAPEGLRQCIPPTGPLVVIANHRFGGIDGVILLRELLRVRSDARVVGNYLLGRVRELSDYLLPVDPFGGPGSESRNFASTRGAIRHLRSGGSIVVFPAGEVAHATLRNPRVCDPAWDAGIAGIVRLTGATVLPVRFQGQNSWVFQAAGFVHPRLRTVLLPREMVELRGKTIRFVVGSPIHAGRLAGLGDDAAVTSYLRDCVENIAHPSPDFARSSPRSMTRFMRPVIAPVPHQHLREEIRRLPGESVLVIHQDLEVRVAGSRQIPQVLREIGRLREVTFRATGEGTGKDFDLDHFDEVYEHLFVWNRLESRIVGAYRLGRSDRLAGERTGFYSQTLFELDARFLRSINPALELGRSFVRIEDQKSYTPLLLLWKGIGRFLEREPRYRYLFGPVSISNDYTTSSKALMVQFLKAHHGHHELSGHVRPKQPYDASPGSGPMSDGGTLSEIDELSRVVAELEQGRRSVPVLIRQYLKLGARFVAFNVDPEFGNCIDGLIVVDLPLAQRRVLERYFSREGLEKYLGYHLGRSDAAAAKHAGSQRGFHRGT